MIYWTPVPQSIRLAGFIVSRATDLSRHRSNLVADHSQKYIEINTHFEQSANRLQQAIAACRAGLAAAELQ